MTNEGHLARYREIRAHTDRMQGGTEKRYGRGRGQREVSWEREIGRESKREMERWRERDGEVEGERERGRGGER